MHRRLSNWITSNFPMTAKAMHQKPGRRWKYHRIDGVSKWVNLDNCWVTRHDGQDFCHVGYFGSRVGTINGAPRKLRAKIDAMVDQFEKDAAAVCKIYREEGRLA